jgi:hypothetical protein
MLLKTRNQPIGIASCFFLGHFSINIEQLYSKKLTQKIKSISKKKKFERWSKKVVMVEEELS